MNETFRIRLLSGDKLLGTMLSLPSPSVAEVLAQTGIDWMFVDAEHGPFSTSDIQAVLQAVEQLPHKQQAALMLRNYQGFSYEEIGAALDCSSESARANVYQAVKKLRKQFAEEKNERD